MTTTGNSETFSIVANDGSAKHKPQTRRLNKMNKHDKFYAGLILSAVENEDGIPENATLSEKVDFAWGRFQSEVGKWRSPQIGETGALKEWFQGLALSVPYMNHEILKLAKESGVLRKNASESAEDDFLGAYWVRLVIALRAMKNGTLAFSR